MAYLLDTNVFITAKNLHYGLDFCPAFWEWLIQQNEAGLLYSTDMVRDELLAIDDDLSLWAAGLDNSFFVAPNAALPAALRVVNDWVYSQNYEQNAINIFFQKADYYLVGQAYAGEHVVVTHERPSVSTRKIKIPDACIGVDIRCISPFQMLRRERARFVLGSSPPQSQLAFA